MLLMLLVFVYVLSCCIGCLINGNDSAVWRRSAIRISYVKFQETSAPSVPVVRAAITYFMAFFLLLFDPELSL